MNSFRFVDLFCGIGGFHQAMESLGGECVFACDIDDDCRKTYEANYKIKPAGDIRNIKACDIPSHDVLCAGFPCQSFSKAGNRLGFEDEMKGTLFFDVCRILEYHKPQYALLENVRNLAGHDKGNTWRVIHDKLASLGYNLLPEPVIFSPHYVGIPQHRERVYIMCIREDCGEIRPFSFDRNNIPLCTIESILQEDSEILNIQEYRISPDLENLIDLWNVFLQNIVVDKLPGFPVWSDRLCDLDPYEDLTQYPSWKQNFIHKNNELYIANRKFINTHIIGVNVYFCKERIVHTDNMRIAPIVAHRHGLCTHIILTERNIIFLTESIKKRACIQSRILKTLVHVGNAVIVFTQMAPGFDHAHISPFKCSAVIFESQFFFRKRHGFCHMRSLVVEPVHCLKDYGTDKYQYEKVPE